MPWRLVVALSAAVFALSLLMKCKSLGLVLELPNPPGLRDVWERLLHTVRHGMAFFSKMN